VASSSRRHAAHYAGSSDEVTIIEQRSMRRLH
jgi:hypothetical protein